MDNHIRGGIHAEFDLTDADIHYRDSDIVPDGYGLSNLARQY